MPLHKNNVTVQLPLWRAQVVSGNQVCGRVCQDVAFVQVAGHVRPGLSLAAEQARQRGGAVCCKQRPHRTLVLVVVRLSLVTSLVFNRTDYMLKRLGPANISTRSKSRLSRLSAPIPRTRKPFCQNAALRNRVAAPTAKGSFGHASRSRRRLDDIRAFPRVWPGLREASRHRHREGRRGTRGIGPGRLPPAQA